MIPATTYWPRQAAPTLIIIAPALGRPQDSYARIARYFRKKGMAVLAFSYRGTGQPLPAGHSPSLGQWGTLDLDAIILYAKNQFPQCELALLAHGLSGELVGMAPASQYLNRLVFISCGLTGSGLTGWKGFSENLLLQFISFFRSTLSLEQLGYPPPLPPAILAEWASWAQHPNGLFSRFPNHNYQRLEAPLLSIGFSDDYHYPPRAVEALLQQFPNTLITRCFLSPRTVGARKIGPNGFFRKRFRKTLWKGVLQWIKDPRYFTLNNKAIADSN